MFFNTDIVVYLSWYFDANDNKYEDKNIKSFSNIVEICKSRKIKLIFISTLCASKYSKSKYNKTKAECEKIALKNNFSVVRFGSVILKGYELEGTYKKLETVVNIVILKFILLLLLFKRLELQVKKFSNF